MSPSDAMVTIAVSDGVATITLTRPDSGNAISLDLALALADAASVVDCDASVRSVILTGTGRFFCVGGDISAFRNAGAEVPLLLSRITGAMHSAIARLARMAKPLIVAVNGPTAGAGLGFAALGDIVIAAQSAHFTAAYTGIGLTPDAATTMLLPRLIGLRRSQELFLTNRRVGAAEAEQIGLVTRVVSDDVLAAEAGAVAAALARGPVAAHGAIRQLLLADLALEAYMEREARAIVAAAAGPEGRVGIAAFLDKRKPDFLAGPA